MAITYVASTSGGATPSPLVLATPTGTQPRDVLVLSLSSPTHPDIHPAFDEVDNETWESRTISVQVAVAPDPVPASYTFTATSNFRLWGGLAAFRGVDPADIVDDRSSMSGGSGTSIVLPSLTATKVGGMLIGTVGTSDSNDTTPPGSMTERWDVMSPTSDEVSNEFATELLGATGATGTRTFTASSSTFWGGIVLILKPKSAWSVGFVGQR